MREDIGVNVHTNDVYFINKNKYTVYPFGWVNNPAGLANYLYGEIEIPNLVTDSQLSRNGIDINIPYTPKHKKFYIRIKRWLGANNYIYIQNPVDGSDWFLAKTGLYGQPMNDAFASELVLVSETSYHIVINSNIAEIYSSDNKDFDIIKANAQNKNLLLLCVPTNNYRYPISGVGLIRWVNSNIAHTKLSQTIQNEFNEDGVGVINAEFDFSTYYINLELDTSSVDNE